jgi:hypothetical protein
LSRTTSSDCESGNPSNRSDQGRCGVSWRCGICHEWSADSSSVSTDRLSAIQDRGHRGYGIGVGAGWRWRSWRCRLRRAGQTREGRSVVEVSRDSCIMSIQHDQPRAGDRVGLASVSILWECRMTGTRKFRTDPKPAKWRKQAKVGLGLIAGTRQLHWRLVYASPPHSPNLRGLRYRGGHIVCDRTGCR